MMADHHRKTKSANYTKSDEADQVIDNCVIHGDEKNVLFCVTCEKGICMECMTENTHGLHKLCKLHEVTGIMQDIFQEMVQKKGIKTLQQQIKGQAREIKRTKSTVVNHQNKMATGVLERSKQLVVAIEKRQQDVSLLLKQAFTRKLTILDDFESSNAKLSSFLEKYIENPESFCKSHKDEMPELVRYMRKLQMDHQVDVDTLPTFQIGPKVDDELIISIFGDTKHANSDSRKATQSSIKEVVKNIHFLLGYWDTMYDCGNLLREGPFHAIEKISPLNMQTVYVLAEHRVYKAHIECIEPSITCRLNESNVLQGKTRDITQTTDEGFFLCQPSCLKFCKFDNKVYALDLLTAGNSIRSLYTDKSGNVVYCLEQEDDRYLPSAPYVTFHKFDQAGVSLEKENEIAIYVNKEYAYRTEQSNGYIYFLGRHDLNGGQVLRRKTTGDTKITVFYEGNIGRDPTRMFDPRGICFDSKGQVIIADCSNHAIHLLDNNGKFLKFLLREWDGIQNPTAITLDKHGFLWIGQKDGTIQIRRYES